ncbi:MAG: patatin-like phospholipase family protein [Pseudomonadota bacterium]
MSERRKPHHVKSINLALQGGGAHGAFTWGILDRMFEDDRLWIEAISGTSAGAVNAVVAAQGMYDGQAPAAREALTNFWKAVSDAGKYSPLRSTPFDAALNNWSLDKSPAYLFLDMMQRVASPYDINPFNFNPFRDLIEEIIDFEKVRACVDMGIFVSATNVETGRGRVFERDEITSDVIMASTCLPFLYQAVEIESQHYWDGGYMGNPPLVPFLASSPSPDILVIQINPIKRTGVPRSAREILNRVNEITFNSSLIHELRGIEYINHLLETGLVSTEKHRRVNMHIMGGGANMEALDASSKLNTDWEFLKHLFEIGRSVAADWLDKNFNHIGNRSSVDICDLFSDVGTLPPSRSERV